MLRANNGKKFFHPSQIENGVWKSKTSWQPFWGCKGQDGNGSWCIDRGIINCETQRYGIHTIVKYDERTGIQYSISLEKFLANSQLFDAGHGAQYACPIEHWDAEQIALPKQQKIKQAKKAKTVKPAKPAKSWRNLRLFGG